MVLVIREARVSDLARLVSIERAADEAFRDIDMTAVADDPPTTADQLAQFLESGTAWVATDHDDHPIAYLLVERVDNRAHIEQVAVHPRHARRRIGAQLIERASQWADDNGLDGLSLTTFARVPWNAPYYVRLGFSALSESEWTPGLQRRMASEASHGLDRWPRVVMVREVRMPQRESASLSAP